MAWLMFGVTLGSIIAMLLSVGAILEWSATGRVPRLVRPFARAFDAVRQRLRRQPEPLPAVLLSLELRRISAELAKAESTDQFAKATRVNACRWAYDRVLIDYCRAVDLPVVTDAIPLTAAQRLDLETELVGAGHGW